MLLRRSLVIGLVVALSLLLFSLGAFAFHDFSDVDSAAFYHDDVHWLKEMGITLGCGGTLFCPNDPVTRGQMAAFLHRASRVREQPGFALTTVDSAGSVGTYTSVAIGVDGRPLVSYYDNTNADLRVAHCSDLACSAATLTTLDSAWDVGQWTSVAIGADGLGLISYDDLTNGDLKVAHCSNTACSAATITALDGTSLGLDVGRFTSITIGTDGLGLISYYDDTNSALKVAHCSDTACTAATGATLEGGPLQQHRLQRGDVRDARQRRPRRLLHLDHHRHRRPRAHQLLRRCQRRPQGRPLQQQRLQRGDVRDARRRSGRRLLHLDHHRHRRPGAHQLLRRQQR